MLFKAKLLVFYSETHTWRANNGAVDTKSEESTYLGLSQVLDFWKLSVKMYALSELAWQLFFILNDKLDICRSYKVKFSSLKILEDGKLLARVTFVSISEWEESHTRGSHKCTYACDYKLHVTRPRTLADHFSNIQLGFSERFLKIASLFHKTG